MPGRRKHLPRSTIEWTARTSDGTSPQNGRSNETVLDESDHHDQDGDEQDGDERMDDIDSSGDGEHQIEKYEGSETLQEEGIGQHSDGDDQISDDSDVFETAESDLDGMVDGLDETTGSVNNATKRDLTLTRIE